MTDDIDRRIFVQGLAATITPVVGAVASLLEIQGTQFWETGESVTLKSREVRSLDIDWMAEFLHQRAKENLVEGLRYQLRLSTPMNFGTERGMAWYSNRDMQDEPVWSEFYDKKASYEPILGTYIIGNFVA